MAGAGLGLLESKTVMNISTLLKPHSEPWEKHQFAAKILDSMFTALKESSNIVLFLDWLHQYGLEPSNSEAHWRGQNEMLVKIMDSVLHSAAILDEDLNYELLNLLSECLTNESKFQAAFLVEVRHFLEVHGTDSELYSDVVDLLEYLVNTQASLSQQMVWVTKQFRDLAPKSHELSKVAAIKVDANEVVESVAA